MSFRKRAHPHCFVLLALLALALTACASVTAVPTDTPLPTATTAASATPAAVPATATAAAAQEFFPSGVAFDSAGNMYVSTCGGGPELIKIDSFGLLTVVAGDGDGGFSGDGGPAHSAEIGCAQAVALDPNDNIYIADFDNDRVRRIDRDGIITTFAGGGPGGFGGSFVGDGGPATQAQLNGPAGLAFDPAGNLYIVDSLQDRIRRVDPNGIISTVAGNGVGGSSGDGGPATAANLRLAKAQTGGWGIAIDAAGNLYFSDAGNYQVRKVDSQGVISTIAGGTGGLTGGVQLVPTGLALDPDGSLYIASDSHEFGIESRVLKIDPHGIITTIVGGIAGDFNGDGGPATAATLLHPWGLALDAAGNLYIADNGAGRVRRVDRNGIITTVAGGLP